MNRLIRTGLRVVGVAALVVPTVLAANQPVISVHHNLSGQLSALTDGTQPPAPPVPLHPPTTVADGTQPPAPNGPMKPPTMVADGTQPPAPNGPMKPPTMVADGTQPPAPNGPMRPPVA